MKNSALSFLAFAFACSALAADDPHLRQVTGVPKFEAGYQAKYLVLEGEKPIRILWELEGSGDSKGKPWPLFPITLEPNTVYVFTVDEDEELITTGELLPRVRTYVNHTLMRIARDGQILYDQLDCAVHQRRMDRIKAEVIVGMRGNPGPYPPESLSKQRFPNYHDKYYDGCMGVGPPTRLKYVCPDCKAAFLAWAAQARKR